MLRLRDGRRLGFAEWGARGGRPIVLFVGGSSRVVYPPNGPVDVRLITLHRPGLGRSDFHAGRKLTDIAGDVAQLLDALGLDRVAVAGILQGGPAALACAHEWPERLSRSG
jgi:pimeloyl-ACP methyl ester carboxylesterase